MKLSKEKQEKLLKQALEDFEMIRRYKDKVLRRKVRTRAKIKRFTDRPRLVVFRSVKHIYGQVIDKKGKVLVAASEKDLKGSVKGKTKTQKAHLVGQSLAQKALKKKIKKVVLDRGGFRYHGRIKAFAEGSRKEGLEF